MKSYYTTIDSRLSRFRDSAIKTEHGNDRETIKDICLATNNPDKVKEIKKILKPSGYRLHTLKSLNLKIDIEETGRTLEKNAFLKAKAVSLAAGMPSLSDDTGLFVKAINGRPGVKSSRFAGEDATYSDNLIKLLQVLRNKKDRRAYFRTVVCLYVNSKKYFFRSGLVRGVIIKEPSGKKGFGYDPVFFHPPSRKTFAELSAAQKNAISHRKIAFEKIKDIIS